MIEFILGVLLSWPILIGLITLALITEHNCAHGWTLVLTLVLGTITFLMFGLTWTVVGLVALAWIPIGFAWSFWRWKRYCNSVVRDETESKKESGKNYTVATNYLESRLDPMQNIDLITEWVVIWPFSMVASFLSDIFDLIQDLIVGFFKRTYKRMSETALQQIKDLED